MNTLIGLDTKLFFILNGFAGKNFTGDVLVAFAASQLIFILFVLFLVIFFLKSKLSLRSIGACVKIITVSFFAYGVQEVLKLLFTRPRPYITYPTVYRLTHLLETSPDPAFPSGHTTLAFALAFAVFWFFNKKIGVAFMIIALLIGVSRIIAGVHYPLDIIGGIALAWLIVFLTQKYILKEG
ncbi:MAG: phosphatase PAP2 family protein [Parcubacteria group bacterium]|nr:phosphatase PAP2 family protein [Parcubacteria group bacterium]